VNDESRGIPADGGPTSPDQPGGIAPPPGSGLPGSGPTGRSAGTPTGGAGRPGGAGSPGQGGGPDRDAPSRSPTSSPGLRLGSPFGIPIFLAPSSLVLALLLAYVFGPAAAREIPGLGGAAFLVGLAFAAMLYGSVLLHELAHSVVARSFGIPVRRIVLQLLGGVSELEREPDTAGRELLVAIAGPALSLVLAAAGLGLGQLLPEESLIRWLVLGIGGANLLVGLFNLLPGLPLDGGRVLRAVAWAITGKPLLSTLIAAWAGRLVAVLVAVLPFLVAGSGGPSVVNVVWCTLIAMFIWFGATATIQQVRLRERLPRLDIRRLTRRAIPVVADLPLAEALRRAYVAGARGMVVVDALGRPTGLVDEAAASATPEHRRPWVSVAAVARSLRPGMTLSVDLTGEDMVRAIQANPAREYLVVEGTGEIVGVLSTADVERAFASA